MIDEEEYIITILDYIQNKEISYDFYKESPDWLFNKKNRNDTINWIDLSNKEKKDILDNDLDKYFDRL